MNKAKAKDKIYMGCRCYERLQPNTKEFTRLAYTETPRKQRAERYRADCLEITVLPSSCL
jgi:hypothetical protein